MTGFLARARWREGRILDGEIRYLMLRADVLMGIFQRLSPSARAEALEAFAEAVREGGRASAEHYRALGDAGTAELLAIIEATAPELGWGRWSFEIGPGGWDLRVENSPFAAGFGPAEAPICAPIRGMLGALGGMLLGPGASATETACAATGAASCRFRVLNPE